MSYYLGLALASKRVLLSYVVYLISLLQQLEGAPLETGSFCFEDSQSGCVQSTYCLPMEI